MQGARLEQYCGLLSAEEIARGMNAARDNARRLLEDARLLLDKGSYATAFALAALSIEESGKLSILRGLALARDEGEAKKYWREYRSHTRKNLLWPLIDTAASGARRARDFAPLLDPDAEHPHLLDKLKQISFYTDCFRKGHWSVPGDVINKELAEGLLLTAGVLTGTWNVTSEEIELWIQFLQPVWMKSRALMEDALFQWDKEMRRRGLGGLNDSVTMEAFFKDGFRPRSHGRENKRSP